MSKRFLFNLLECLVDLGVTVTYAALVGIAIAVVDLSDGGWSALGTAILWVAALPAATLALVVVEAAWTAMVDAREERRRLGSSTERRAAAKCAAAG